MKQVPVKPRLKSVGGSRSTEHNTIAVRVVDHVNKLVANDPDENQQYDFENIARDLDLDKEQVRSAIANGGGNGITLRVRTEDRASLAPYKTQ